MELHERMKAIQTDSDIKVRTLASAFHIGEQSLGNYLNGKHRIPYDVLIQFSQYYHVTTDYLLGLTDEPDVPYPVSAAERRLLDDLRTLSREQKELIAQNVELMKRQNQR